MMLAISIKGAGGNAPGLDLLIGDPITATTAWILVLCAVFL